MINSFALQSELAFKETIHVLCTEESLYAPYSLLLISSKFWMGGGKGGESVGEMRGGRVGGGE